jgi:hypothetical protein
MLVPQQVHDLGSQTLGRVDDATFLDELEVLDDEVTNYLLGCLLYFTEEVELLTHVAQLSNLRECQVSVEDRINDLGHELRLERYDVVHD